jgi:hypothetical protein
VVDDKEAAAADRAKRKREWVTLAANQSFTPDWEESPPPVAVSQSSSVAKSEAPTAPVNHNKERKICIYMRTTSFYCIVLCCEFIVAISMLKELIFLPGSSRGASRDQLIVSEGNYRRASEVGRCLRQRQ